MPHRSLIAWLLIVAGLATVHAIADDPKPAAQRKPNHLARETSPYLLLHAHNPVDWYPWGDEAFAKAKKEQKLVFLSIGYSSCYWCHVMERESFANDEVARILNDAFVCIKVDREERPDVDAIYLAALQVQGKSGGWPLSMFLTPDGKPIVGGTYWPREDREIMGNTARGFKSILKIVNEDWKTNRQALEEFAGKVADAVQQSLAHPGPPVGVRKLEKGLVLESVDVIKAEYDEQCGGFGSKDRGFRGPKFPRPTGLDLLLWHNAQTRDPQALRIVTHTLERMALGGIYDQVGGGFHRYSTDREWKVPHFEKMLYDNAQLVSTYSHLLQVAKQPWHRRVIDETLAFVAREMTAPAGGFYSALDAETDAEEGKYYVWTAAEVDQTLSPSDAKLVKQAYGMDAGPNFENKANVLLWPKPPADVAKDLGLSEVQLFERLQPAQAKLLAARGKRSRPLLDTKILTGWNGLMIAGYADAAMACGKAEYLQTAVKAADFILKNLRDDQGRLLRTYVGMGEGKRQAKLNACLEDYAYLVRGLLTLHDATQAARWLDEAQKLTDAMLERFEDKQDGGFFFTSHDHEKLFARSKDQYDGVTPSANSVAALNLVRLAQKTKLPKYRSAAERTLKAFAPGLLVNPGNLTAMAQAVGEWMAWEERNPGPAAGEPKDKKPTDAVEITAQAEPTQPGADGMQVVTVTLAIAKGWHVYANAPGIAELIPTTVEVNAAVKPAMVKVAYPEGQDYRSPALDKSARVYQDKVTIKIQVVRGMKDGQIDQSPLDVSVRYQACDDKACQLPRTVTVRIPK